MLEISMNNPLIQYVKRARARWNAGFFGETRKCDLSKSICGLFWQIFGWAAMEFFIVVFLTMAVFGMILFNGHLLFGFFDPLFVDTPHPNIFFLAMVSLGIIASFMTYGLIGFVIGYVILQLFKTLKPERKHKEPSVIVEYAKSYKDKYCPLVEYKEE